MTKQTPATDEIEKWPGIQCQANFWLGEISDLLLFVCYFVSQNKEIKFGNYFLMWVVKIKTFWLDVRYPQHAKCGNNLNHWKFVDLCFDLKYFSLSHPKGRNTPDVKWTQSEGNATFFCTKMRLDWMWMLRSMC